MYTETFGRVPYLVARSRGKKSLSSKALFMPLSLLDLEVEHLNKRELHRIKEVRNSYPLMDIYCHPVKNVLALFLSEVLYRVVRDTEPDGRLFNYLCRSVQLLNGAEEGVANFHLVFLLHLPLYLGVHPNVTNYAPGCYFDMLNGIFTPAPPLHPHYLNQADSQIFARLTKMSFENSSLYAFSRHERALIIDRLFEYYRLHLPEFSEVKSLAVLQSLFD